MSDGGPRDPLLRPYHDRVVHTSVTGTVNESVRGPYPVGVTLYTGTWSPTGSFDGVGVLPLVLPWLECPDVSPKYSCARPSGVSRDLRVIGVIYEGYLRE